MPSWSNTPSGTMRAAILTNPGAHPPSACFTIDPAYPKPTLPSSSWILVRVYAAGLNRAELRGRNNDVPGLPEFGPFQSEFHTDPPPILGEEFVGIVDLAGSATSFKPGDKVAGMVYGGGKAHDGAYAEYTLALAERCFKFESEKLPWEVLGGIPMSMWTAYGSLFDSAETKPGATVLVHGGTSSVGIWGILLAKDRGCTVIATTRQESKLSKLKAAGADHALLEENLVSNVLALYPKGVDTIFELVGPDKLESVAFPILARHGACVVSGILTKVWALPNFTPAMIPPTRKLCFFTCLDNDDIAGAGAVLQEVIEKVESGKFPREVFLDRVFKLAEVGEAHEYMEENKAVGKVVLLI